MSDYSEHLISMAGGDGDVLDNIQRRADKVAEWRKHFHAPQSSIDYSQRDVQTLIALVREQAAKLDAIRDLANSRGQRGWHVSPSDIRATLGATK